MPDVVMPKLSETMSEGTILRWIKVEGDDITEGDELVEIEVAGEGHAYRATESGRLIEVLAQEGTTLGVDELIGRIEQEDEGESDAETGEEESDSATGPEPEADDDPQPAAQSKAANPEPSPLVQRIARQLGVDLGLGAKQAAQAEASAEEAAKPEAAADADPESDGAALTQAADPGPTDGAAGADEGEARPPARPAQRARGEVSIEELTRSQQTVARRMAESKATAPHFYLQIEADISHLLEALGSSDTDLIAVVIRATALTLADHPRLNGAYRDAKAETYGRINVGIATPAHGSLVVPTIFDADTKNSAEIAREIADLAEQAEARSITPPQLSGGTFTVISPRIEGVDAMIPVLNPPQVATLGVGSPVERPVVRNGEVVAGTVLTLSLSADHRMLYGQEAGQFLADLRGRLEEPDSGLVPGA